VYEFDTHYADDADFRKRKKVKRRVLDRMNRIDRIKKWTSPRSTGAGKDNLRNISLERFGAAIA
jgi:hypothetical protein